MRLPMASVRTLMPASRIHEPTNSFARRIAGDANVRVSFPSSSLICASASRRCMVDLAKSLLIAE